MLVFQSSIRVVDWLKLLSGTGQCIHANQSGDWLADHSFVQGRGPDGGVRQGEGVWGERLVEQELAAARAAPTHSSGQAAA